MVGGAVLLPAFREAAAFFPVCTNVDAFVDHDLSPEKEKAQPFGLSLFYFLPSIIRIPSLEENRANYFGVVWRVSYLL